jgi:methylglutaconyl-CoA hydratase
MPSPSIGLPSRAILLRIPRRSFYPSSFGLGSAYSTASLSADEPFIVATDLPASNTGYIRVLELNRSAAKNSISRGLLASLRDQIEAIHQQYDASNGKEIAHGMGDKSPTRALILASAVDGVFCAGADLKERKGFTPEE